MALDVELRPYQNEAVHDLFAALPGNHRVLLSMPTGCGKTVIGMYAAAVWPDHCADYGLSPRVLWLAHRDELIWQAANQWRAMTGEEAGIEKAERSVGADDGFLQGPRMVVSSVQTLMQESRRFVFPKDEFGLVVADESYHIVAPGWREVADYFDSGRQVGLTATTDRADEISLGTFFHTTAYHYELAQAIKDGWLSPIKQEYVKVDGLDFSGVKLDAHGDLSAKGLEERINCEKAIHGICAPVVELAGQRQTIIFTPSVGSAEAVAAILPRYSERGAASVSGKTPPDERKAIVQAYLRGDIQWLVNCSVFCLDDQTEMLTTQGWRGIDSIQDNDEIANWQPDGHICFCQPQAIFKRWREPRESMIHVGGKIVDFRVSGDHTLIIKTGLDAQWRKSKADRLVGKKAYIPLCGNAEPLQGEPAQPESWDRKRKMAAIRSLSFVYRQKGLDSIAARRKAGEAWRERRAMQYRRPNELTLAECSFIGFWIGDGCRCELSKGGLEYTLSQSSAYPKIIEWIDRIIGQCDLDVRKRPMRSARISAGLQKPAYIWSFGRGTGFGSQKRNGVFHLEPYLNKSGSVLFWSLSELQFDALLHGLWMADGNHRDGTRRERSHQIAGVDKQLRDLLQAVAVCRGYRAAVLPCSAPVKPQHRQQYCLTYHKGYRAACTGVHRRSEITEETIWRPERLWCVKSDSGFIIIRRNGKACVVGNCEGFDAPKTSCIVIARPTGSRALYAQMIGRGLRGGVAAPVDGKSDCLVIDLTGKSGEHKLVGSPELLAGDYSKEVQEEVHRRIEEAVEEEDGEPADVLEEVERAVGMADELRRKKFMSIIAQAKTTRKTIDPFDLLAVSDKQLPGWWDAREPLPEQIDKLKAAGIKHEGDFDYSKARRLCDEIDRRKAEGLCSYKQAKQLAIRGFDPHMRFEAASLVLNHLGTRPGGWTMQSEDYKRKGYARKRGRLLAYRECKELPRYCVPKGVAADVRKGDGPWQEYTTARVTGFNEPSKIEGTYWSVEWGDYTLRLSRKAVIDLKQ